LPVARAHAMAVAVGRGVLWWECCGGSAAVGVLWWECCGGFALVGVDIKGSSRRVAPDIDAKCTALQADWEGP
jgi:hypothetical protein